MTEEEIFKAAMAHYGELSQYDKLMEEMFELGQAILKLRRYPRTDTSTHEWVHLHEEFVDVEVVMGQIKTLLEAPLLYHYRSLKLTKLTELVEKGDTDRNLYK